MSGPCYYCEENRDYACKVCIHHYKGPTVEELKNQADRIRELEAELAALRQQQGEPVAWKDTMVTTHHNGAEERIPMLLGYEGWEALPDGTELYREAGRSRRNKK